MKDKKYSIRAIRNHFIKEVKPVLLPVFILVAAGVFLVLGGLTHVVSFVFIPDVIVFDWTVNAFDWASIAGILLFFAGLLMFMSMKPHYALRINTAEGGEDDVIISKKREYLKQIIDALNRAFMLMKN